MYQKRQKWKLIATQKRNLFTLLLTLSFILLSLTASVCQINREINNGSRNMGCDELLIINKDYLITLNGKEYTSGDMAFICEKELDVDITIINAADKQPVVATNWDWKECKCLASNPQNHEATLRKSDLDQGNATIEVKFKKDNKTIELKLDVVTDIKVKYSKIGTLNDNFDSNLLSYPNETKKYGPALYIPSGMIGELNGEAKPQKSNLDFTIDAFDENGINLLSDLLITPNGIIINPQLIKFNLINEPIQHKEIAEIHSCQKDLVLFTRENRTATIKVFNLCETDDDEQINFGQVLSATDICVAPGADGSLDEYASLPLGKGTRWVDKDDEVVEINGVKHVVAGPKLKDGQPYCNTTARQANISYPNVIDFTSVMNEVKTFYSEKANFDITFEIIIENLYMNFDSRIDDDKMHGSNTIDESRDFRISRYGSSLGRPSDPETFIVKGVIHSDPEAAAFAGGNVMFVQDIKGTNTSLVWAHEIGHQIWELKHPDKIGVEADDECWMKGDVEILDKLSNHRMNFYYLKQGFY